MGFFTPKISERELSFVQATLKQLNDSVLLVNTTTKPDVFFKRLNFTLDLLLCLQSYEKYRIFKPSTPTQDYTRLVTNLEATVDDFIDRAVLVNQQKVDSLKTEKAKQRNRENFLTSLISAFDCTHSFWQGNFGFPHYTGPLFTQKNYDRVQALYNTLDDLDT